MRALISPPQSPPGSRIISGILTGRAVRLVIVAAALAAAPSAATSQQASIHGIITSSSTDSPLEGVAVVLEAGGEEPYGTITDRNGFYQIGGIEPGSYLLRGQQIGFAPHSDTVVFAAGERLTQNLQLEPSAVAIEGVLVSGARGATVRDMGRQRVTAADLRLVPVPAGSGDLAAYLQTLPGVTTTGDRGGHLFVRGGTAAENLILVDGIPIYQPFHILGFFSVFPEDLVSSVDFFAGGFGARYHGRTSSVLDVALRDGNPNEFRGMGSASPFLAEVLLEGPLAPGVSWLASARRSLIGGTSEALLGTRQPLNFDSQLFKLTIAPGDDQRCSALGLRSSDRGRLDPEETGSYVAWKNMLVGGKCVLQFPRFVRLLEVNFSASSVENAAVSLGSSRFESRLWRMQHDVHSTSMVGAIPLHAGFHVYAGLTDYDLSELFGVQQESDGIFGLGGYAETAVPLGQNVEVRPGLLITAVPQVGLEPRIRASWEPFGRSAEKLEGALGVYRQYIVGTSDMRDVGSVFVAWSDVPEEKPLEAVHATLGWQQALSGPLRWSIEGYYKRLREIPVPAWRAIAQFTTRLSRADGEAYGVDTRIEYTRPGFYSLVGYGYGWTQYGASAEAFGSWFGDPVQQYHPPHDRRHQINAVATLDFAGFDAAVRWQLGTGLPFTRPLGFDEAFDHTFDFYDFTERVGTTRLVLNKPFTGRLPATHRLDLSLGRQFDLVLGRVTTSVGVINAYDRRNMFYYDLYSGRRVDQLPIAPYASLTVRRP